MERHLPGHPRGDHLRNHPPRSPEKRRRSARIGARLYFDDRRVVPLPSKAKRHQQLVELPASVAAKVLLLNELVAQGIRPADLARRLKLPKSEMTRILDPHHATKIDPIAAAMAALGKRLELSVAAAA